MYHLTHPTDKYYFRIFFSFHTLTHFQHDTHKSMFVKIGDILFVFERNME